jgi:hypothetical protein
MRRAAGSVNGFRHLADIGEQIHADGAIDGKISSSRNHQRKSGGNQKNWKLERLEGSSSVDENQDASHDENNGQGGQPGKETEHQRQANGKLRNKKEGGQKVREVKSVGARPNRDRTIPPGSAEPAERVLNAMVERHGCKGQPQKKRRKAAGRGKKGIYGIVRHGADANKPLARRKAKVSPPLSLCS